MSYRPRLTDETRAVTEWLRTDSVNRKQLELIAAKVVDRIKQAEQEDGGALATPVELQREHAATLVGDHILRCVIGELPCEPSPKITPLQLLFGRLGHFGAEGVQWEEVARPFVVDALPLSDDECADFLSQLDQEAD